MTLLELCQRIEAGEAAEKCMYDDDMIGLAEQLWNSTAEIKALVEENETLRLVLNELHETREALRLCAVALKDLSNGWPERELHEPIETTLERAKRFVPEVFE